MSTGKVGGDNGVERGKLCQGTCIKDPWMKPKGIGLRVEGRGRWGGVGGGKWRQLYLNNNKIYIYIYIFFFKGS